MLLQVYREPVMTPIPADIWTRIAHFIPKNDLQGLISINSRFFQLAMDSRYHDVNFNATHLVTGDDSACTLRRMRRLRDPAIATRVRCLRVDMGVQEEKYVRNNEGPARWDEIMTSLRELIQTMTDVVTWLTNVTEFFYIESSYLPAEEYLSSFLVAAWRAFGPSLCKLTLRVPWVQLPNILSNVDVLPMLRNLDVELHRSLSPVHKVPNELEGAALLDALADFLNKVAPTLRGLSIASWVSDLALSSLFFRLRNIPNLEKFSVFLVREVNVVSTTVSLVDPIGLARFLRSHGETLRHLDWFGAFLVDAAITNDEHGNPKVDSVADGDSREHFVLDWLSENKLDDVFLNLLTLRLPLAPSPANFSLIEQCIKFSANTLTSFGLHNNYLTFHQVTSVISIFECGQAQHLRELNINVESLSNELILLVARTFPRLEKLSLDMLYLTTQPNGAREPGNHSRENELAIVQKFADAMSQVDIRDWSLDDISIKKRGGLHLYLTMKIMWVLAECVPSVQTFHGTNKEVFIDDKL